MGTRTGGYKVVVSRTAGKQLGFAYDSRANGSPLWASLDTGANNRERLDSPIHPSVAPLLLERSKPRECRGVDRFNARLRRPHTTSGLDRVVLCRALLRN